MSITLLLVPRRVDLPWNENLPLEIFSDFAMRLPPFCSPLTMQGMFQRLDLGRRGVGDDVGLGPDLDVGAALDLGERERGDEEEDQDRAGGRAVGVVASRDRRVRVSAAGWPSVQAYACLRIFAPWTSI
jgi:hypothetical protein